MKRAPFSVGASTNRPLEGVLSEPTSALPLGILHKCLKNGHAWKWPGHVVIKFWFLFKVISKWWRLRWFCCHFFWFRSWSSNAKVSCFTLLNKIILQVLKVLCFNLLLSALFCFDEFPGKGTKKGKQVTISEENIKDFAVIRGYMRPSVKPVILISFNCPLFV